MNRLCLSRRLLTGSLAVACAALAWAQGEVISFNFGEDSVKLSGASGDPGLVEADASKWMCISAGGGTGGTSTQVENLIIKDAADNIYEGMTLEVASRGGSWHNQKGARDTAARKMLGGFLDDSNGQNEACVRVKGITFPSYTAYVYFSQDAAVDSTPVAPTYTINGRHWYGNGTDATWQVFGRNENWGTVQCDTPVNGVNTLVVPGLTGEELSVIAGRYSSLEQGGTRGCISGLQIVNTGAVTECAATVAEGKTTFSNLAFDRQPITEGVSIATVTVPADGTLVFDSGMERFTRIKVVSEGAVTVMMPATEADIAKVDLTGVKGAVKGSLGMTLASSAKGSTYVGGAGTPDRAATTKLDVANGTLNLSGGTYYLNQCSTGTQSTVNITDSAVTYIGSDSTAGGDACLGVGQATYTVGGSSKVTAPGFYLSNGDNDRTSVFTLKDKATLTVTGESNVDSNQASIMFGHWIGPSTFTLQDNAKFVAEKADVLVGKTYNTHKININGGTFRARGIRCSNMDQTSSLNLSGGRVELGTGGLKDYGTQRLSVNVTGNTEIASYAAMEIAHTMNIAKDQVLTLDGTNGAITVTAATPFSGEGTVTVKGTVSLPLGSEGKVTVADGGVLKLQLTANEMVNGYTSQAKTTGTGAVHLIAPNGPVASESGHLTIGGTCTWENGVWTPSAPTANNHAVIVFDAEHAAYTFDTPVRLATLTIRGTGGTLDATADVPYASCVLETDVTTSTRFLNGFIGEALEIPEGKTVTVAVAENIQEELKVPLTGAGTLAKTDAGTLTLAKQAACKTDLRGGALKSAGLPAGLSTAEGTTLVMTSGEATIADATPIMGKVKVEGGVLKLTATPITFTIELVGGDILTEKGVDGRSIWTEFNRPVIVGGGTTNARIRFTGWASSGKFTAGLTLKDKAHILIERSGATNSQIEGDVTVDAPDGNVYFGGTTWGDAKVLGNVTGVGNVHLIQYEGGNLTEFKGVFADKSVTEKLAVTLECGHLRLTNAGNTYSGGTTVKSGVTYPVGSTVFGTGPVAINGTLQTSGNLTLPNQLTGGGNLNLTSGTLAVSHENNTFSGKVDIAVGAMLDLSAEGARLFTNGRHLSTNDAVTVHGTLKTRNWNYGQSLGWVGHNTPYVVIDGGTVVFTETFASDRGFTVTGNGATLMVADGCRYTKNGEWGVTNNGTLRLACVENESGKMALGGTYVNTVTVGKGVTLKAPGTFATLTAKEGATLDINGGFSVATLTPPTGGKINVVGAENSTVTFTGEGAAGNAAEVNNKLAAAGMTFTVADAVATLKTDTNAFAGLTVTPEQATVLAQAAQAAGAKPNADGQIAVSLTEKGAVVPDASVAQITAALEIFSGVASVDPANPSELKVAYNFGITAMSYINGTLTLTAKVENDGASAAFADGVTVKLIALDGEAETEVPTASSEFVAGRQEVVLTLTDLGQATTRLLKVKAVK